jgi:hypothetical protein
MMTALVLTHLAATLYMTGLIWFVQLVHYPLFARAERTTFADFAREHQDWTFWAVGPAMLVEALSAGCLLVTRPAWFPEWAAWLGLALVCVNMLSTVAVQIPLHQRLSAGYDAQAHARLVASNWLRTFAWTARAWLLLGVLGTGGLVSSP